jgi:hypothetical protein
MGDFNINFMNYQCHNKTGEFVDSIFSNMLYPRITRPTRITAHTATLIDNILEIILNVIQRMDFFFRYI